MASRKHPHSHRDWNCPDCDYLVFGTKSECEKCGKFRPKSGDWKCQCGETNFAKRTTCHRCSKTKPSNSNISSNSSVSDVQYKPGDWFCIDDNCKTLNFGNRTNCFKCGRPKDNSSSSSESIKCKICFDRQVDTSLPCGHVVICKLCALTQVKCPICRRNYSEADIKSVFL